MAAHDGGLLDEDDIQEWLNEKSPADLVNALFQSHTAQSEEQQHDEWSHTAQSEEQQHEEQQHSPSIHNEKQFARIAARREFVLRELAGRPPPGNKVSQKRSERASKRPRGPRGRYLSQEEIAALCPSSV